MIHRRCGVVAAATAAVAAALLACAKTPTEERACSGTQAMSAAEIRGGSMPAKTVALTFDDGPGIRTAELSTYLQSKNIRAAFFVNGMNLGADKSILTQLVADGHVVANHTQTHRSLTGRNGGLGRLSDGDIVDELTQTDTLIAPYVPHQRLMFRPPFGDYDQETYRVVAASPMNKYVGPIGWDIGDHMGPSQAADWDCWKTGDDGVVKTPQQCAELYVKEIDTVGKGIVLLHDPYFIDDDPAKGGTVDLVKLMVPALVTKGYAFARVDEVPEIAGLLPPLPPVASDAGADAPAAPESSSGGAAGPAARDAGDASGGNPDPCSASPQSAR